MRMPLWLRCLIAGLGWGAFMYAFTAEGPRTLTQGLIHLVGGLLFGLVFWGLMWWQERRFFGDLSTTEREAAVDAVRTAQPPGDPRVADAAERLARRWAAPKMRPRSQVIFFAFFVLLSIYVALEVAPWAWIGVLLWPLAAWYSIRQQERQQRIGQRYLRAVTV